MYPSISVTKLWSYGATEYKEDLMEITEELKRELGNAIAAYGKILHSAFLGASVPPEFEKLKECSDTELKHKMQILKEFYSQL